MAKAHNPSIWDKFGKGTEHDEIRDLFIALAQELDKRLLAGNNKDVLMNKLREASEYAHRAVAEAYPPIKEVNALGGKLPMPKPKSVYEKFQTIDPNTEVSDFDAADINYKKF